MSFTSTYAQLITNLLPAAAQIISGGTKASAGAANDTTLAAIVILKNATAVTLLVAGVDAGGGSFTLTGSTTLDTQYYFGDNGTVNQGGALTFTASVANLVAVMTKPKN